MKPKNHASKKPSKALAKIDEIEAELKRIGRWSPEPQKDHQKVPKGAFGEENMTFCGWLQLVLIPRVREMVRTGEAFPADSQVGVKAVREFDGDSEAQPLVELLIEFDAIFSS